MQSDALRGGNAEPKGCGHTIAQLVKGVFSVPTIHLTLSDTEHKMLSELSKAHYRTNVAELRYLIESAYKQYLTESQEENL